MKIYNNIGSFYLSLIIFASCQEKYDCEDIVSDKLIPVINGRIADDGRPWVKLSWASAYNAIKFKPIKGAKVYISDDVGYKVKLKDNSDGMYFSSTPGITGKVGCTYTLQVELPDKKVFESFPERMTSFKIQDSIYASIGSCFDPFNVNAYGDMLIQPIPGLDIYTDVVADTDKTVYSRIAIELATESTYGNTSTIYIIRKSALYDKPNTISTSYYNSKQVTNYHYLGFLLYGHDNIQGFPLHLVAWITTTNYYSISTGTYKYYQAILNQLDAKARMFDPIPSQLKGNIRCITDSSQLVLGYFEVNAKILTRQDAFYWDFRSDHFKHKRIDTVLYLPSDSASLIPFWNDF